MLFHRMIRFPAPGIIYESGICFTTERNSPQKTENQVCLCIMEKNKNKKTIEIQQKILTFLKWRAILIT